MHKLKKECLAIVFACERFNQYTHGRDQTVVQTGHRPLVPNQYTMHQNDCRGYSRDYRNAPLG